MPGRAPSLVRYSSALIAWTALAVSAPAPAQDAAGGEPPALESADGEGARLTAVEQQLEQLLEKEARRAADAASQPTLTIFGQLQVDYLYFSQDAANRASVGDAQDGSDFRRARVGARGEAFEVVEYAISFDFALPGRPSFLDVFVGVRDLPYLGHVRAGHFFEPFSLERNTNNRYLTFMERSLANTFAPARNLGLMAQNTIGEDQRGTWAVGWFRTASNDFGDDFGDEGEQAVTARATRLLWYDELEGRSYLHVGGGYSFRDADQRIVRFASRPEARAGSPIALHVPIFVDTGDIPALSHQLFGVEAAWVYGPLSIQTEYIIAPVRPLAGPDLTFHGAYAYVSYFLTGEHRPYSKEMGNFDRVIPFENFFRVRTDERIATGRGAWEIAARWSFLDLSNRTVQGGTLTDFTVTLNWYLNPYTRVKWEYINAQLDRPPVGDSAAHIFGMRFDFDF